MSRSQQNQIAQVSIKRRAFSLPTLLALALALAFLTLLVTQFDVDLGDTWDHVKTSNPWYLALAFLVHYTTFLFRGARWRLLLRNTQDKAVPVPSIFYCSQLILLGWFANSVGGFRVGDAYRAYLYSHEQSASFPRTIGTLLAERVLDSILIVLLLLVATLSLVSSGEGASWTVLGIAGVLLALLAVALLAMGWTREWLIGRLPGWLAEHYRRFHEGILGSFRQLRLVFLLGLLGWLAEVGRLYLVVQALGFDLGLDLVIFIATANSMLSLVPTPGGVGAVESGVAGLLVRITSLSASAAAALVIVDRAISYLSIIVTGAILFLARQALRSRSTGLSKPTAVEPR